MVKKSLAWSAWAISVLLLAYDRGARGLGWLAAPADFIQYVATPWSDYAWPSLRERIFPMLTLEGILFTVASITLMWVYFGDRVSRWIGIRRQGGNSVERASETTEAVLNNSANPPGEGDNAIKYDLNEFATDYILPLCNAHIDLQEKMLGFVIRDGVLSDLAAGGIMHSTATRILGGAYDCLQSALSQSPTEILELDVISTQLFLMDKNYHLLFEQLDQISNETGINYRVDSRVSLEWRAVCDRHDKLVDEYWKIKRDRRLTGTLYRPGIGGPWTEKISESGGIERDRPASDSP